MKTIVAIPAYNEKLCIGSIVLQAKKYATEVVVVDDGSTDGTGEIAESAGALVIRHDRNRGYGAAIQSSLEAARRLGADVLVTLDGDGQHDPQEIPQLIQPIVEEGVDLVIGRRPSEPIPLYRRLGQWVLNRATNIAANSRVGDSQSGFRAFSRRAFQLDIREEGYAATSGIIVDALGKGLKIKEVPISVRYDVRHQSNPVVHGFSVLFRLILLIAEQRTFLFFSAIGAVFMLLGLLVGWNAMSVFRASGKFPVGEGLLVVLLLVIGVLNFNTGLILSFIGRILRKP